MTPARLPSRRTALTALAGAACTPVRAAALGQVLIVRHALTEPGIGDPPGFVLGQCATQRNLSSEGRAQARAFGERLAALGLRPLAVRSSRWCRCLHTADEIAAAWPTGALTAEAWPALDSTFGAREREAAQTAQTKQRLARLAALRSSGFELWVTHQINITALTGQATAMGQALWLSASTATGAGAVEARPFN